MNSTNCSNSSGLSDWTDVRDALPDPGDSVIVTCRIGTGSKTQLVVRAATYLGAKYDYPWSGNGNFKDVLAWIRMPEPYQREEEHEEYYSIPESIFGHHELTDEEKKQYEDYFNKTLKKDRE